MLVILCVLVTVSCAVVAGDTSKPCDITEENNGFRTINCSRRSIDKITDVLNDSVIQKIYKGDTLVDTNNNTKCSNETTPKPNKTKATHVLITFANNSIQNITKFPHVPASQIAVNFKNNQLVEIESGAFSDLDRLFYLDLSNNLLTGEVLRGEIFQGPYELGVFANIALESLYLSNNKIHSLDRYLFQYTPNLTRLYLNNNPIEILDYVTILALSSVVNLEVLDLSNTAIDSVPDDTFKGLLKLREVDLSGNRFLTVPESLSIVGQTLEYLTFNNNSIVELTDDSFVGLVNLKELAVGDNDYLEEVKRSTFSPLKNLKVLHLCHNRNLRFISHQAFRGMKNKWTLNEVYLDDNNLSELSTDLMPWSKLQTLGMTGNYWLCNCDLANIVNNLGAGQKFSKDQIPRCAAPMKLSGQNITNITLTFCPVFDNTFDAKKKGFSMSDLKPKHVLWSIIGVALIVCIGMVLGLGVNALKSFYRNKIRAQPIRYVNLNIDSSFA